MKTGRRQKKNKELAFCLKHLRNATPHDRNRLMRGMMLLICSFDPDRLDNAVMRFPLDPQKGRWYDDDPDHWLAINGLRHGGRKLQRMAALYLQKEIRKQPCRPVPFSSD